MGEPARSRLALALALILLVGEGLSLALLAAALYSIRGLNLGGAKHPVDVGAQVQFVQIMALWGAVHLIVAAAAALSRGAAWRVTAGAVQLIDFMACVILWAYNAYNPGGPTPGENAILVAIALVPLAGAALVLVPLGSPPADKPPR
jgi:hypothetical protein